MFQRPSAMENQEWQILAMQLGEKCKKPSKNNACAMALCVVATTFLSGLSIQTKQSMASRLLI
jgi:hypothetical protein